MPGQATDKSVGQQGFTLIETVFVLIILAVVAVIGGSFIVWTMDAYRTSESRFLLSLRARAMVEQITREVRNAVPESLRVSESGNCFEFFPIVDQVTLSLDPRFQYEASVVTPDNKYDAVYLLTPAISAKALYESSPTSSRALVSEVSNGGVTTASNSLNSLNSRSYLAATPLRYCLVDGKLIRYSSYGVEPVLEGELPAAQANVVAENVSGDSQVFTLRPGSANSPQALAIAFNLQSGSSRAAIQHSVVVRNAL